MDIQTATSKAEAIELLNQEASWMSQLAVAFIDVVMASDTALRNFATLWARAA